jgi:hypothetical protein
LRRADEFAELDGRQHGCPCVARQERYQHENGRNYSAHYADSVTECVELKDSAGTPDLKQKVIRPGD